MVSSRFGKLVEALSRAKRRVTVIESSTGGLIQASIMAVPGASRVFGGGTCAYATDKSKYLVPASVHAALEGVKKGDTVDGYVRSKIEWARAAATGYAREAGASADIAVAEAGAMGPTFRPDGLQEGFSALCVAGVDGVLAEHVVWTGTRDREKSMRVAADAAAELTLRAVFEGDTLDRALSKSASSSSDPRARFVVTKARDVLVTKDNAALAFLTSEDLADERRNAASFLGVVDKKVPVFAVDIVDENDLVVKKDDAHFARARPSVGALTSATDKRLLFHAVGLAEWHRRSGFCAECGSKTEPIRSRSARRCVGCGSVDFPRQDPSIIVVVGSTDGGSCLLTNSPRHPPRLFTAVAGFVEVGETFEEAVAREVFEETGAKVIPESVRYVASQPWPFPRSCMVGFLATADPDLPLSIDRDELVDASWFSRADVRRAADASKGAVLDSTVAGDLLQSRPDLPFLVPPPGVVARTLIDTWLDRRDDINNNR